MSAGLWTGALCAAVAVATAVPADAAGFIRYDVATLGEQFTQSQSPFGSPPRFSNTWESYIFSVVVPVDQTGIWSLTGSTYSSPLVHNFVAGGTEIVASANAIGFHEFSAPSLLYSSSVNWGDISGSICADAGNTFVTTGFRTNCGSVSWANNWRSGNIRFTGGIVDVRVSTGTGASPLGYGVVQIQNVPLVPEPATWAMMTLGFGLAGYALRRRTDRLATT